MSAVTTTCGCCGASNVVPYLEPSDVLNGREVGPDFAGYDVCALTWRCECGAKPDGGNSVTGECLGWISAKQAAASQREYERQQFSADCNAWMGRGNHPF